ncbi:MAG: DUF2157 domain-containing protein [Magnetococcales bacterium]|nr:DUF2157 domain-containing protein [Magnetococcales bacterium]
MPGMPQQLQEWTREGLISPDQAAAILSFEKGRSKTNWLLYSFMSLGAGVLGIGILTLIAANWEQIPKTIKLGSDLLLMLGIAYSIWKQQDQDHPLAWELLIILFTLGCLASIGLIGQLYHASAGLDQALLLWAVIVLPIITLSQRTLLPLVWIWIMLAVLSYRLIVTPMQAFSEEERALTIGYSLPLVCALAAILLRPWSTTELFARAFRFHAWLIAICIIIVTDASSMANSQHWHWHASTTWVGIAWACMVLAGIAKRRQPSVSGQIILSLLVILYTATPPLVIGLKLSHWFSALFTMALFALAATWLVREGSLRLANGLVFLLGMRFLVLFFTAFGGLIDAGIGMILSGVVILGFVWLWSRVQKHLLNWMERMAPS